MFEIKPGEDRGWESGVAETEIGLEESSPFFLVRTMFMAMRRWEEQKLEGGDGEYWQDHPFGYLLRVVGSV